MYIIQGGEILIITQNPVLVAHDYVLFLFVLIILILISVLNGFLSTVKISTIYWTLSGKVATLAIIWVFHWQWNNHERCELNRLMSINTVMREQ